MPQKILAGRSTDPLLQQDLVEVRVDQVVLTRAPAQAVVHAQSAGLKKTPVEVAIAYDGTCVTSADGAPSVFAPVAQTMLAHGLLVAKPGVGFCAPVHLERFASPARLGVTDDPRMCFVGGLGMLSLVVPPGQLGEALARGAVMLRPPRSIQVLLSGRIRPFVCARDISLELLRRDIAETVRKIDAQYGAPVVIEFGGPSARLLSVPERAVLCAIAPATGAASAVFISDEKSESYLRDQRRSKAHRALAPDPGAPCDDVISVDLSTVDPLLMDEDGEVRPVRDLAGKPVHQVILGGDSGATMRDILAAAALLKSKRVPPRLELLLSPPSRQVLEVLASTGALVDLVATGARIIEPDQRVLTGRIYPSEPSQTSLRTFVPEPVYPPTCPSVVASAETVAYAVATGQIGDPRSFKRPVRVTVPRTLPTEDVLITRTRKGDTASAKKPQIPAVGIWGWTEAATLQIVVGLEGFRALGAHARAALVLSDLEEVRRLASDLTHVAERARAVLTPFVPSAVASVLSGTGIAVFRVDAKGMELLAKAKSLTIPGPLEWGTGGIVAAAMGGDRQIALRWLGKGVEKHWVMAGVALTQSRGQK